MKILQLEEIIREPWRFKIESIKPEFLELSGIKIKPRGKVFDFPDVTQGHYAVAQALGEMVLEYRKSTDFPDVTGAHKIVADYLGNVSLEKAPNFVDFGSGAGFLGVYFGKNFKLNKLIFSDFSEQAIKHSKNTLNLNYDKTFLTDKTDIEFREGDAKETLLNLDGGIGVCAPYLIPEVCTMFPGVYNLFGCIAKSQGMDLYVGHSNLSQKLINESAERNNMQRKEVYRASGFVLTPEYANGDIPEQMAQKKSDKLFPETISKLKVLGLKEKNGNYFHEMVVTKFSDK